MHVTDFDVPGCKCLEIFYITQTTTAGELVDMILERRPAARPKEESELCYQGERLDYNKQLKYYGLCDYWIVQMTGFCYNPVIPGKKFIDGCLVPIDTPDPDWDDYSVVREAPSRLAFPRPPL